MSLIVTLEFPGQVSARLFVTPMGDGQYRLDATPTVVESPGFGDIIAAEVISPQKLRYLSTVQKSGWRTYSFVSNSRMLEGPKAMALLDKLESFGGRWEEVFGSLLLIHIPPGLDLDPTNWIMEMEL